MGLSVRELCPIEETALPAWFALRVKHKHEQTVRSTLELKGFEALAPTYRARRRWSDRIQEVELPLFHGYVFCRFALPHKILVQNTPSVANIVSFGGTAVPLGENEIDAIRKVTNSRIPARPWPNLKPGDRVVVERGPLRGVEGQLWKDEGGCQLIIRIELLQRAVAVALEPDMIAPARAS